MGGGVAVLRIRGARGRALAAVVAALLVLLLGAVPPRPGQAAPAPARLDRHLRQVLASQAAPAVRVESLDGVPSVDVVVQSARDVSSDLTAAGGRVRTSIGRGASRLITARVPVAALQRVGAAPGVTYVSASVPLEPITDISTGADHTQAQTVWSSITDGSGLPVTGKGVLIAVADSGIDLGHQDFRNADGSTRLVGLWDQTVGTGGASAGSAFYAYGSECTPAQINAGACAEIDSDGHGTHVAGIAASAGRADSGGTPQFYKGLAPDADLLVVKSDLTTGHVIDAWTWMVAKARAMGKPVVVDVSLGAHVGAHDGTAGLEAAIDALSDTGVIFVVAAGNSGAQKVHGSGTAAAGSPATAKLTFPGGALTTSTVDFYYRSADSLTIAVTAPDGHTLGPVGRGSASTSSYSYVPPGGGNAKSVSVEIRQDGAAPNAQTVHSWVTIGSASSSVYLQDTWQLTLAAAALGGADASGVAPGRWDGWIASYNGGLQWVDAATGGTNGGLDYDGTLTEPATARRAVVAASYVSRASWTDQTGGTRFYSPPVTVGAGSSFSSRGATRDGRQKPDVAAPGQGIIAARSSGVSDATIGASRLVGPNGRHRILEGTSMAAPHVAGAIALMLQVRPSLAPEEALALLRGNALQDAFTGLGGATSWNTTFGAGKLRALAPVQTAQALPVVPTSTPTGIPTASATVTATPIPPATATMTTTPAVALTGTPTPAATPGAGTATATASGTPAGPPTASPAAAQTATPTATTAVAGSATATGTPASSATTTATRTATATRTVTPTRTITPTPVNEILATLPLRRAAAAPAAAYVTDVTLAIYTGSSVPGSRTPVATFATRTDESGTLDVQVAGGLPSGRYDFVVRPARAVSREINGKTVTLGAAVALTFHAIDEGDADGDDDVDGADAAIVLGAYGRAAGESGFDSRGDLDRDGVVTIRDFSLLTRSLGLTGPVQEP